MTGKKRVIPDIRSTVVLIGAIVAFAANAAAATPSLSLSGASGVPGSTVTLDVSLNSVGSPLPAAIQWDLTYSTSDLSLVTGTYYGTGAAGSGAGKAADCNSISAGDVRCIVSGIDTTAFGSGVVATLTFQIAAGTTDTSTPVSLVSPAASDGNANALAISASGATVTITQPVAPVLSSLNCSPASVTPPATSTCTVSLSGTSSSTTTVNLSSGAAAAIVPTSVNITVGLTSTTFTVSTSTVSTSTPAVITATLGSVSRNFTVTLTTAPTCAYSLSTNSANPSSSAGSGSFDVSTSAGCSWTVTNNSTFITITGGSSGAGNGTVSYSVTANSGAARIGTLTIATQTFTVTQSGQTATAGLAFYPLTPCRIADTRVGSGLPSSFGAPYLSANTARDFPILDSACNVPSSALAYSLNIGALPHEALGFLTVWPAGFPLPLVGTLGSPTGHPVSNAALVPAGTSGAISLYANADTDVIIDIDGYFGPANQSLDLAFYTIPPCRVADTRTGSGLSGPFGSPSLSDGVTRTIPVPASACGLPSTALAYSLNLGALPQAPLGFLTAWPAGSAQPLVGTLGSPSGQPVSNAALVPAGTAGAINLYANAATDVTVDSNGYFAPPGSPGALTFYPLTPCRIADTRTVGSGLTGAFGPPTMTGGSTRAFPIPESSCNVPPTAQAYSLNIGVVAPGPVSYLTTWATGQPMPLFGTLSAPHGGIVSDATLVAAGTAGAINTFVTNTTDVIIDINGYFAP